MEGTRAVDLHPTHLTQPRRIGGIDLLQRREALPMQPVVVAEPFAAGRGLLGRRRDRQAQPAKDGKDSASHAPLFCL
jgi:hypothetical protein